MNPKQDIKQTIKMLSNKNTKSENSSFENYDRIYPFTNEAINLYYKYFKLDENVLTVAASGDQLLHAILQGCKHATIFDINKLTKYYVNLKIAAVKALTLEEFMEFFINKTGTLSFPTLNYSIFKKIESYLSDEDREYWNLFYQYIYIESMEEKKKYFQAYFDYKNCDYLIYENYIHLKQNINECEIDPFINCDLLFLDKYLNSNYDTMFLSNIGDYIDDKIYFKEYIEKKLSKYLTKQGKIIYGYSWINQRTDFRGKNYAAINIESDRVNVYKKAK